VDAVDESVYNFDLKRDNDDFYSVKWKNGMKVWFEKDLDLDLVGGGKSRRFEKDLDFGGGEGRGVF